MASLRKELYSPEVYLARDREAEEKSEYWDGYVYTMPGANRRHNVIVSNVGTTLNVQLAAKPCEVYPSDMRVRIPRSHRYLYPDVTVVCGEPRFEDERIDILVNPTVVVEVLSESTERFDRGKKFDTYRQLDSLQVYVLIAQDEPHVYLYTRQTDGGWLFTEATALAAVLPLAPIGCELSLADVYRKVQFPTPD